MTNRASSGSKGRILMMVQFALLAAIEAIVCFTPLGSLPVGPLVATLSHIPVIVTAILLGPWAGTAMGFLFGLFSFLVWTFTPPSPIAFVFTPFYSLGDVSGNFWSVVICFVPRMLLGLFAGLIFRSLERKLSDRKGARLVPYGVSAVGAALAHTLLVLGGIYIFFGRPYAETLGTSYELLLGALGLSVVTNGILEAVLAGVVAAAVCLPLRSYLMKKA